MKTTALLSRTYPLVAALGMWGCVSTDNPDQTASGSDAGSDVSSLPPEDAGPDSSEAASAEGSTPDTGSPDSSIPDTGSPDNWIPDAGSPDNSIPDTGSPDTGVETPVAQSDLARDMNPVVTDADKTALTTGMSAFAFDLFGTVNDANVQAKNFVCSPASVSLALGMAYAGAAGNTAAEFRSVLHITQEPGTYFKALDWLSLALEGRAAEALTAKTRPWLAQDPAEYRLHVVNSIWGEKTLAFEKPFLDTLAADFGAGMYLADFVNQPDPERVRINRWVSQQTRDKINDLLPAGSIDGYTRAVLVNALHLKLPWNTPFYESSTKPGLFALAGGTTATVQYMRQDERLPYSEDALAQAVALPLAGGAVHLVLFVPKTGTSLADLESASLMSEITALTGAALAGTTDVTLMLPRFKFTIDSSALQKPLEELGLIRAFDATAADFSGITKQYPLLITDVVHKAMVGVKETGIEAAAATAVVFADGGVVVPPVYKEVKADHPFFFGIYDKPTATWLFVGHVVDPSQGDPP